MKNIELELTPVRYPDDGVKVLSFSKTQGESCFRMHWHERLEAIRVKSGVMRIECGDRIFRLHKGEMALFPPKKPHHGFAEKGKVEYDVVMFDVRSFINETEACKQFLSAMIDGRAKFHPKTQNPDVLSCVDEILNLKDHTSLAGIGLVYRFLSLVFDQMLAELTEDSADEVMHRVLLYIQEHFADEINTSSLSRIFGYSSSHFCRKFKETTWLSPTKYIQIFRLEEASKLLALGNGSVSQVALLCGFSDQNYFARCFKKHFGMTPVQYKTKGKR